MILICAAGARSASTSRPRIARELKATPRPPAPVIRTCPRTALKRRPPVIPTAGAIGNAISHALGLRLHEAPYTPRRVLEALERR